MEVFRPMYYRAGMRAWRPRALLASLVLAVGAFLGGRQDNSPVAFYSSMVLLFLAVVLAMPTFVLVAVRIAGGAITARHGAVHPVDLDEDIPMIAVGA